MVSVDSEAVYLVDPRCPADTPSARSTRRYPVCRLCANTQRLLEPACLCRFRYACPPQVAHTFGSTATQQDLHDGAGAEASPPFHFPSLTQRTCQQSAAHTTAAWHIPSHACTRAQSMQPLQSIGCLRLRPRLRGRYSSGASPCRVCRLLTGCGMDSMRQSLRSARCCADLSTP